MPAGVPVYVPVAITFLAAICGSPQGDLPFFYPATGAVGRRKDQPLLFKPIHTQDSFQTGNHCGPPHVRVKIFTVF